MLPVLRVTQQQHVIRKNGFPWRKVREPPSYANLISLKNSGIALDRLHERACLTLLGRAALAEASAAQAGAKLVHGFWAAGEIVGGKIVGIERKVRLDALEPRDHAGERAHVLSETRNRGGRGNTAVSAARHQELAPASELERRRRAVRVAQCLAAASRALRAARDIMLYHAGAQEIETDDVIVELGPKRGGDRFCNLHRCELDAAAPHRVACERRDRDRLRAGAIEQSLDLPVALHALGKTHPAGALARPQPRAHQRKNAGGLREQPQGAVREMPGVQLCQASIEIIVHQGDGEIGRALADTNAKIIQRPFELGGTRDLDCLNADTTFFQIPLDGFGRNAKACPISARGVRQSERPRRCKASLDEPIDRFVHLVRRKFLLQLAHDLARIFSALSDSEGERAIELAMQKELAILGIEANGVWR